MARRVILSAKAYADIDRIVEFNNRRNRSEIYSKKFVKALYKQFQLLKNYQFAGIRTSQNGMFVLIYDKFYIFYNLRADDIEITLIYHQKENITL